MIAKDYQPMVCFDRDQGSNPVHGQIQCRRKQLRLLLEHQGFDPVAWPNQDVAPGQSAVRVDKPSFDLSDNHETEPGSDPNHGGC